MSPTTIERFHDNMEKIIAKSGYFIQAVLSNDESFAYTIGRTDKGTPEFYIAGFNARYGPLLNTIPADYDAGEIEVGVPFHRQGWLTVDEKEKTWFVIDEVDCMQLDNMLGATGRAARKNQTMVKPLQIIIADRHNKLPGQYVLPELPKVAGAITAAEAKKLYEENWDKEFTTMEDLYARIRTLVENGAYELAVYVDSSNTYYEVKAELQKAGFCVGDYNDGKSNILEITFY